MLERGELASLHQDIPAQGLDACQTGLRDASPPALAVAVIVRTRRSGGASNSNDGDRREYPYFTVNYDSSHQMRMWHSDIGGSLT
jgi:hypothetical protein